MIFNARSVVGRIHEHRVRPSSTSTTPLCDDSTLRTPSGRGKAPIPLAPNSAEWEFVGRGSALRRGSPLAPPRRNPIDQIFAPNLPVTMLKTYSANGFGRRLMKSMAAVADSMVSTGSTGPKISSAMISSSGDGFQDHGRLDGQRRALEAPTRHDRNPWWTSIIETIRSNWQGVDDSASRGRVRRHENALILADDPVG